MLNFMHRVLDASAGPWGFEGIRLLHDKGLWGGRDSARHRHRTMWQSRAFCGAWGWAACHMREEMVCATL